MGKIQVLSEHISNKIAAGEVVERPVSVVKELVENSIDAGATTITVEIKNGGISYIRVTDNGSGMDNEDAKASFIRHATSKIYYEKDLSSINTLGFRGEALASIASVSEAEMLTKLSKDTYGTKIQIDGGEYKFIGNTGCPDGTTIIIKNIFYNTPARLKFLKSESRETAIISETMTKLALSKPSISFKFINNGKHIFSTPGDGEIRNTIVTIYGRELYNSLIGISYKGNILSISGFIGNSEAARSNRNFQTFFVNNRYIKNKMFSTAVDNAYKTFLPLNKFAFCILYISIYPELVDVNVHPTKAEVRFQDDREVFSAIFNTVRSGLAGEILIPEPLKNDRIIKSEQQLLLNKDYDQMPIMNQNTNRDESIYNNQIKTDFIQSKTYDVIKDIDINKNELIKEDGIKNLLPPLLVIGQCHYTYILAQGPDTLYIIDQHAAHERIMYERYRESFENRGIQAQNLLTPIVLDLTSQEIDLVKDNVEILIKLGFDIEFFGNNSVILRSVPVIFGEPQLKKFFLEMIDLMDYSSSSGKSSIDGMLYTMACKSAVKANDKLGTKEMEEIINMLRKTTNPYTCPHGRPTIIKLTKYELEKKFKRV